MNKLIVVPSTHIDVAWKEGAHRLGLACATSGGEISGDQLKMMLSRGERTLLRMDLDETAQLPRLVRLRAVRTTRQL
jgi:hypothetical protein